MFYGKYRGKVASNRDPLRLGRIQVEAPEVLGSGRTSWAMPCVPFAGQQVGIFAMPPVGANVWVEFEGGSPDHPIWSGCFWGKGELPAEAQGPEVMLFKGQGVALTISNMPTDKGFKLEVGPPLAQQPLTLTMDDDGIALTMGQLALKLTAQDIQLDGGATTLKLQSKGIDLASSPAALKLSSSGVEASSGAAAVKVASASVELSNGASSVKLSPASVNVNNGALEVM